MRPYLEHLSGFVLLLDWQATWRRRSAEAILTTDGFELGLPQVQRFVLGSPRRPRYGRAPFLGAQPTEMAWLSRIRWRRASVCWGPQACLHLISQRMRGDGDTLPDIASFAVGWSPPDPSTLHAMSESAWLEGREVWTDEDRLCVASGPPVFSVPLTSRTATAPVLTEDERDPGQTMEDLIAMHLKQTNRYEPPQAPFLAGVSSR